MKNLYLLLLLSAATPAIAQDTHFPFQVIQTIPTSDTSGVACLFTRQSDEVGFVHQDGTISDELPVPGRICGLGKFKGNIVALYTHEWPLFSNYAVKKEVHAMVIDAKTHKSLLDKVIYNCTGGMLTMIKTIDDEQDNFQYLLIRTTGQKGNSDVDTYGKEWIRTLATTALSAIALNPDGAPREIALNSAAINADFIAAYANQKGELAILSHLNGQLTAEQFNPDGQLGKKLTTPLDYNYSAVKNTLVKDHRGLIDDDIRGRFDPRAEETLTFALSALDQRRKNQVLSLFVFDFAAGKIPLQQSSVLNGDYRSKVKENPDWKNTKNCKDLDEQRPDAIVYLGDKLVIFTEIRYLTNPSRVGAAGRYEAEGAIANIYDRQYHLVHQLFLDKNYESFEYGGQGLSYHIRNRKIYAFGTELDGIARYRNALFVIDTDNNSVSKTTPDYGEGSRQEWITVDGMFWSDNFFAKYQPSGKKMDGSHTNSFLTKYNYQ